MPESYNTLIQRLVENTPFEIDTEILVESRPPTMASSEFLTNKEQGDWAEQVVLNAINDNSNEYFALPYGRADSLAAGDPGFGEFYRAYQEELNTIGKKPDLLIFRREDALQPLDLTDDDTVSLAVAAIEVRSSSFLADKYAEFMHARTAAAETACMRIREELLHSTNAELLSEKKPAIYKLICDADKETFRDLDFRAPSWSASAELRQLTEKLKELKAQMKILHKRDYLSITPKLEDISLVNRWIQRFGVRHFYLQVFFDKAYVIAFEEILKTCSDPKREGIAFSVERDVKNQQKTTIKIDIRVGREILGRIDEPEHKAARKELDRGRLLFYVTFEGGRGYLDPRTFEEEIINGK